MERTPDNFFRDFQKAAEGRKSQTQANYQRKILQAHFPELLEGVPGFTYSDEPLVLVKEHHQSLMAQRLFIEHIVLKPSEAWLKLPSTEVWKKFMTYLDWEDGDGKVVLVYQVKHLGNWVLHNLGEPVEGVKKQVNQLYYGDGGVNLLAMPLKIFIQERNK